MSRYSGDPYNDLVMAIIDGKLEPKPKKFEIELRDARTGEKLGLTNVQFKQYEAAMQSNNPVVVTNACNEVRERRMEIRPTTKFKCVKPT